MSIERFKREYMGEFRTDHKYEYACYLWAVYYHQTEQYDRVVCRRRDPQTGNALPLKPIERQLVDQNARHARKRMVMLADERRIDRNTLKAAGKQMVRLSMRQLEEHIAQFEETWRQRKQKEKEDQDG